MMVLFLVAAPIVLANFTPGDYQIMGFPLARPEWKFEYGWPLIWYWRQDNLKPGQMYVLFYDWACLIENLAIWSAILAAIGAATEWVVRHYRLPPRCGLRTLLAAVAIISVLCAWCASLRERAKIQDPLIAEIEQEIEAGDGFGGGGIINMERWGPKWLDLLGVDRFRRHIAGVHLYNYDSGACPELLNRLGRLPGLRFLYIDAEEWSATMVSALGELRQLRALHVTETGLAYDDYDDCFAADLFEVVGKLTQLRVLSASCNLISPHDLGRLSHLSHLRSLRLGFQCMGETEVEVRDRVAMRELATIADLPAMPHLEFLSLHGGILRTGDLRHLGEFRRLKALDLEPEFVADGALVELASLKSLEELAICADVVSARGLERLASLKRLKRLHIPPAFYEWGPIRVDATGNVFMPKSDFDRCRRALDALRLANPGVVIDCGDTNQFAAYRTFDKMRHDALFIQRWPQ